MLSASSRELSVLPLSAMMISPEIPLLRNASRACSMQAPSVSSSFKHGMTTEISGSPDGDLPGQLRNRRLRRLDMSNLCVNSPNLHPKPKLDSLLPASSGLSRRRTAITRSKHSHEREGDERPRRDHTALKGYETFAYRKARNQFLYTLFSYTSRWVPGIIDRGGSSDGGGCNQAHDRIFHSPQGCGIFSDFLAGVRHPAGNAGSLPA